MAAGDWIPEQCRERVEQWADIAQRCTAGRARALIAFGPHVFDDAAWHRQPLGTVLVLAETNLDLLRRLAAEGNRLGRRWIAAPLIMSPAFIQESLDTFPLELLDIQQQHQVIFGADPFANLQFHGEHIRLQCERECKVMLTKIRQGILGAAGHEALWPEMAAGVAEQCVRSLRGMLCLRGVDSVGPIEDVLRHAETTFGQPLAWVGDALAGSWDAGWTGIQAIYRDVERLARWTEERTAEPIGSPISGGPG